MRNAKKTLKKALKKEVLNGQAVSGLKGLRGMGLERNGRRVSSRGAEQKEKWKKVRRREEEKNE